ncbi:MAG: hypothetical protein ACKPKW_27660 [Dolichospermum sp.]
MRYTLCGQDARTTRVLLLISVLQQQNTAVSVRYSRGLEADAACGQLRTIKR